MTVGDETRQILISASLGLAAQSLSRSHQLVSDARTALYAVLAVDVAAMLGLVAVVATLAANGGSAPGKWWVPGLALVVSSGFALSGIVGRLKSEDAAQGTILGTALAQASDQDALNAFEQGITAAATANLGVVGRLERRGLIAIVFFVLALALTLVPIWLHFPQVFPL
jgi:Kef-type K+ transport system membrane component KefB